MAGLRSLASSAALLGGLVLASTAAAQDPAGATELQVNVEPARFLLGATEQATVTVRGSGPLDPAQLRLRANAGSLGEPTLQDDGSVQASYSPPKAFYPHIAIVAAIAQVDGVDQVGWAALPLVGQGELSVPGKANSDVTVAVGEKTFGPVKANASGQATIRVEVPPGYTEGVSGDVRTVPIPVVGFSRILAVSLRSEVEVSADAAVELRVFVVTARGKPANQATLRFKATRGTAGGVKRLGPGVYAARFKPRKKAAGKQAKVVVSMAKAPESISTVKIRVIKGGAAAQVVVRVDPAEVGAGADPAVVTVLVQSAAGQPLAVAPTLEASQGLIGTIEELGPGQYRAPYTPPESVEENTEVILTATVPGPNDSLVSGTGTVTVLAGMDLDNQLSVASTSDGAAASTTDQGTAGAKTEKSAGEGGPFALELGLHGAFETNFVALYAPGLAFDVTLLGMGALDGLALRLELGGLYQGGESALSGPLEGRTVQRQLVAVPASLQADYRFHLSDSFDFFAGIGGAVGYSLHAVDESQAHALDLAALAQLGLGWRLGPGELVVKLRYLYGGLATPYGGLAVLGGYAIQVL